MEAGVHGRVDLRVVRWRGTLGESHCRLRHRDRRGRGLDGPFVGRDDGGNHHDGSLQRLRDGYPSSGPCRWRIDLG